MTQLWNSSTALFTRRHFDGAIILLCVRWYITDTLSYRDLKAMMAERGIDLAQTTIMRGVQHSVPEFEERWQRYTLTVTAPPLVEEPIRATQDPPPQDPPLQEPPEEEPPQQEPPKKEPPQQDPPKEYKPQATAAPQPTIDPVEAARNRSTHQRKKTTPKKPSTSETPPPQTDDDFTFSSLSRLAVKLPPHTNSVPQSANFAGTFRYLLTCRCTS
jgi:hypothetical protein